VNNAENKYVFGMILSCSNFGHLDMIVYFNSGWYKCIACTLPLKIISQSSFLFFTVALE
jgi:hypothetical protein